MIRITKVMKRSSKLQERLPWCDPIKGRDEAHIKRRVVMMQVQAVDGKEDQSRGGWTAYEKS